MRAVSVKSIARELVVFERKLHPDNLIVAKEIAPLRLRSADGSVPEIALLRILPGERNPTLIISVFPTCNAEPRRFKIQGRSQEIFAIIKAFFADRNTSSWTERVIMDAERLEAQARDNRTLAEWITSQSQIALTDTSSMCVGSSLVPSENGSAIAI